MSHTMKISRCNHVTSIGPVSWNIIKRAQKHEVCDTCEMRATNLWLCLVGTCTYVGCGESLKDHSSHHAQLDNHCLAINLATLRIWCYRCETEVYHDRNQPPFLIPDKLSREAEDDSGHGDYTPDSSPQHSAFGGDDTESDGEEDGHQVKPKGLTGLQNLGNTCYLNAALQALSNCPPLTRYFLDCAGFVHPDRNPSLSKNYMKLMNEIWHRKRPSYLVPSGIVSGIKLVHPMFRGYSQQDTQEFLRCFMDQLHEELKQPIIEEADDQEAEPDIHEEPHRSPVIGRHDRHLSLDTSSNSSQSDGDYETCDSAIGSERETTHSSDENSDINEYSKMNIPSRQMRSRNSLSKSENCSDVTNRPGFLKDKKDSINMSKKQGDNVSTCSDDQRSDSGDYVDAEVEPLRSRRRGNRTVSGSAEKEHSAVYNKSLHGTFQQTVGPGSKKTTLQYQSVISDIFDGKLSSSVQCLTCERVSTTKETFQDLSLPIPPKDHVHMLHSSSHSSGQKGGACSEVHQGWLQWMMEWMRSWFLGPVVTLQDCLGAFFSADELKGDNMYSCEKCKKLRNGLKYSKVLELPEFQPMTLLAYILLHQSLLSKVLSIHLKRFRHEFYSSKISTYVSFPLTNLDMKPYLHKDHISTVTAYDLVAVICHHGTAGGGHYTAYCQNVLNEQWYEFDDQSVTEVDVGQVVNCEAYVLFYRKQNDHMNSARQEAVDLMSKREPSLMHFFVSKQWINRFNTFAEPGPISNQDFLCPHGGVHPSKIEYIGDLVEPLTQVMWEFLHERFGGGPACNHLFLCTQCHKELEDLRLRQKTELEEFIKLNEKFKEEDNPTVIYAISMSWFKEWENFVREKEDTPPGPIDNKRIAMMKSGQLVVRANSDHGQLSGEMWLYLYQIYGGGPELVIKQINPQHAPARTLAEQAASSSSSRGHDRANSESSGGGNPRANVESAVSGKTRANMDSSGAVNRRSSGESASVGNPRTSQDVASTGYTRANPESTGVGHPRANAESTGSGHPRANVNSANGGNPMVNHGAENVEGPRAGQESVVESPRASERESSEGAAVDSVNAASNESTQRHSNCESARDVSGDSEKRGQETNQGSDPANPEQTEE